MSLTQTQIDSIVERGQAYYDARLRAQLEPEHSGKFLVLDVDTGAYEIDADQTAAFDRAIAANPSGSRYLIRIGHAAAHRLGGRFSRTE